VSQDKWTKLARGMECQIRLAGICNFNPETTVLAHYRMSGVCGMGMKPHSLLGAWACSSCHDAVDRRTNDGYNICVDLDFARGVLRTLNELIKRGKL
jgi:Protein of unknown function (DUF1364)